MEIALITKLNDKERHRYGLEFYGINDLSTGWTIKNIFEDMEKIKSYYLNNFNRFIDDFNDYLNFLFLEYLIEFKECYPNLKKDGDKVTFKNFIQELENKKREVNIGNLCKFIISEYKYLFQKYDQKYLKHSLRKQTIKIIGHYGILNSNEEVAVYLIKNNFYSIFDNLDVLLPQLKQNKKLLKKLYLDEENFEKLYDDRLDTLLLHANNFEFKVELLDKLYNKITLEIKQYEMENTQTKGLKLLINLPKLYDTFYKNRCKFISEFGRVKMETEDNIHKFLTESGFYKSSIFEISNESYKAFLEQNSKVKKEILFFTISHDFHTETGFEKENKLEKLSRDYKPGIIDFISTLEKTNEFYTLGKMMLIDEKLTQNAVNLLIWIDENYQVDFFNSLEMILKKIHNFLDLVFMEVEIKNDIKRIKRAVNDILDTQNEDHNYYCQNAIFIFISSFEKIIRTFIYKLDEDNFYKNEKATLKGLLKSKRLIKLIGKDTIMWINYYFLEEDNIGINYRNKVCHYKNKLNEYSSIDTMKILWIVIVSINSICINLENDNQ